MKELMTIGGKKLNMGKVLIPRKGKTVKDFINELTPNIERIMFTSHKNGTTPFKSGEHLKKWLVANQEGYEKFNYEIYAYFAIKLGFM